MTTRRGEPRLGPAGRRFLAAYEAEFDTNPHELEILRMAARCLDEVTRLTLLLVDAPYALKGSRGAVMSNPLLQELRAHRASFVALVGAVNIEGEKSAAVATVVSDLARHAARKRWQKHNTRRAIDGTA
jgi:hypothetical protein